MLKTRKLKIQIILFMTIFALISVMPLHQLYASSATTNPYENKEISLEDLEEKYHNRMNGLFNTRIKLMIDEKGESEPPKNNDACTEDNYSTFCIAMSAATEFEQYQEALIKRLGEVEIEEGKNIIEVSAQQTAKTNEINAELIRAKKALDTTLQAYNELKIAYPMHVQYEETIKNLTEYNKKMSKLRQEVEQLPGKFIDATTSECT